MILRVVAAMTIVAAAASTASAQQVWLSVTQGLSSHRLLGDPRGPSVGVTWLLNDRFAARVGVQVLSHRQTRVGRACAGLIEPGTCPQEEMNDGTTLGGVVVGLIATVVRRDNFSLALIPAASILGARTSSRGQQTGNTLDASSPMRGIGVGAELSVVPRARWPVAVHLAAHVGRLTSPEEAIVDGYSPFVEAISLTRLELGVSVWKPRPSSRIKATR